jgi:hypothetical protein
MFRTRTLIAIGFLVIVGGFAAWKLTRPDPNVRQAGAASAGVPTWPLAGEKDKKPEVDELEIAEPNKPAVQLKKEAAGWRLVQPVADNADQKMVDGALATLAELRLKDVIAESPESYEAVGVKDEDVVKVTAKKGGQVLATLLVGKTTNVRLPDGPKVYSTSGLRRASLVRETKLWRDRALLALERDQVDTLGFDFDGGAKLALKRIAAPEPAPGPDGKPQPKGQDKWEIVAGKELVGGPLDEQVPAGIMSILARVDANDVADGANAADVGLAPPRVTVTVGLKDGSKKVILVGKIEGEDGYIVLPEKDPAKIWKVRKFSVENLSKAPLQWRDKQLAKIDPKDVVKIEIAKGADKTVLTSDGKAWTAVTPAGLEIDQARVSSAVAGLQNFKAASIVEKPAEPEIGLAKPAGTVTVTTKDGKVVTVTIGALKDKAYYLKVNGRSEVFTMGDFGVNRIFKAPTDFKKPANQPTPSGAPGMPPGMQMPAHPGM